MNENNSTITIQRWWKEFLNDRKKCELCLSLTLKKNYIVITGTNTYIESFVGLKNNSSDNIQENPKKIKKTYIFCDKCLISPKKSVRGIVSYEDKINIPNIFKEKPIIELNKTKKENMKATTENDQEYIIYVSNIIEKFLINKYSDLFNLLDNHEPYYKVGLKLPIKIKIDSRIHAKIKDRPILLKHLNHTDLNGDFVYEFKEYPLYLHFTGKFLRGIYTFKSLSLKHNDLYNYMY